MNVKFCSAALIAAAALASCSSEEPVAQQSQETAEGTGGFLTVKLQLPVNMGSRAATAVTQDPGTAAEYKVNNGTILIFAQEGTSELDYKFVEAKPLTGLNWSTGAAGEITTSSKAVAKLTNVSVAATAPKYYAYVVLNNDETNGFKLPAAGATFGSWLDAQQAVPAINVANGLYMASAPQWKDADSEPVHLAEITPGAIKATEAELGSEYGVVLYAERGVAKLEVKYAAEFDVAGTTYSGCKVKVQKWAADITAKNTYPGRNTIGLKDSYADIWKNAGTGAEYTTDRFVSGNTIKRIEFAKSPTFSTSMTASTIGSHFNLVTSMASANTAEGVVYLPENTFDIEHMKQNQTTRVLYETVFIPAGATEGATFYTFADKSVIYKNLDDLKAVIKAAAAAALHVDITKIALNIDAKVANAGNNAIAPADITVDGTALTDAQFATLHNQCGIGDGINTYLNGLCYYVARVKHFGDFYTPWGLTDPTYDGNNLKWLGRYGIVRNTWYELTVTQISKLGEPSIPEPQDVPDDEKEYYIQAQVNVLPWSKRVQEIEL